jgi:hypothetical protein
MCSNHSVEPTSVPALFAWLVLLLLLCRCYITPKLYLDLLQQYSTLLNNAKAEFGGNRRRLLDGIAKLAETNAALDAMQSQLNGLRPLLVEKTASTSALLKQVSAKCQSPFCRCACLQFDLFCCCCLARLSCWWRRQPVLLRCSNK